MANLKKWVDIRNEDLNVIQAPILFFGGVKLYFIDTKQKYDGIIFTTI